MALIWPKEQQNNLQKTTRQPFGISFPDLIQGWCSHSDSKASAPDGWDDLAGGVAA